MSSLILAGMLIKIFPHYIDIDLLLQISSIPGQVDYDYNCRAALKILSEYVAISTENVKQWSKNAEFGFWKW